MLFVNKPKTIELLDHWLSAANKECTAWKYQHTREQMCLQILYDKKYKKNIKIIPYDEINGMDGKWVKHYMNTSKEERLENMKKHFHDLFDKECMAYFSTQTPCYPMGLPTCPTQKTITCPKQKSTTCPWLLIVVVLLIIISSLVIDSFSRLSIIFS